MRSRGYVERRAPVLIGVDGGADALLDRGLLPDLIVGDMDSAGEAALRSGAELVVHGYPGEERPAPRASRRSDFRTRSSLPPARARTSPC